MAMWILPAIALLFLAAGYWRSLPLSYHIIVFCRIVSQSFALFGKRRRLTLGDEVVTTHRCMLDDCDWNWHMNNAAYLKYMDFGRIEMLWHSGLILLARRRNWLVGIGGISIQYRREIKPFEKFQIKTQVRGWDAKWLFLHFTFLVERNGAVVTAATGFVKVVTKNKREDVPWPDIWAELVGGTESERPFGGKHDPIAAHVRAAEVELEQQG